MKIVLLDRDGVINKERETYIRSAAEWESIDGSIEAIVNLSQAGYSVFIITNQSGLARGLFSVADLEEMHDKMSTMVATAGGKISQIYYCPHHPDKKCTCRKPAAGMLEQLMSEHSCQLDRAYFVGDTIKDIGAAQKVGAQPILVRTGQGMNTLAQHDIGNAIVVDNLLAASQKILSNSISFN